MSEEKAAAEMPVRRVLVRNSARCRSCGDEVESKHRHDFRGCSCGRIFVDGGLAYCRRGWTGGDAQDAFEDTSVYEPKPCDHRYRTTGWCHDCDTAQPGEGEAWSA